MAWSGRKQNKQEKIEFYAIVFPSCCTKLLKLLSSCEAEDTESTSPRVAMSKEREESLRNKSVNPFTNKNEQCQTSPTTSAPCAVRMFVHTLPLRTETFVC